MRLMLTTLCSFLFMAMLLAGSVAAVEGGSSEGAADLDWLMEEPLGDDEFVVEVSDPFEGINRLSFAFNDKLHDWLLQPVNRVYSAVLPTDLRRCLKNFFCNLASPVYLANNLLQGKLADSGVVLARFALNSTIGIGGLVDVAESDFGLLRKKEDLGQTLGTWGVGEGFYICWPVLGPSTLRDSMGMIGDGMLHPTVLYQDTGQYSSLSYTALRKTNRFSLNPDVYVDLRRFSLDPYVAMRQAYAEYRYNSLNDQSGQRGGVDAMPVSLEAGVSLP